MSVRAQLYSVDERDRGVRHCILLLAVRALQVPERAVWVAAAGSE